MTQPTFRDDSGELYAKFKCPQGHKFDLGPIHDPIAFENDPDNPGGYRSVPGSGQDQHVPETTPCRVCGEDVSSLLHIARLPLATRA